MSEAIQDLCETGQKWLTSQHYIESEQTLAQAEREAFRLHDWDSIARLYMPLQEARRQRRQRAAEGVVCLSLLAEGPGDTIEGRHVIENFPHGQLLVAGWGSLEPALQVRRLQGRFKLFVDVFLGAKYPLIGGGHAVVIVPHEHVLLPDLSPRRLADMPGHMPAHSIIMREEELPQGILKPSKTLDSVLQGWWERLHRAFLADARRTSDLRKRIEAYRRVIRVDYACEFAHQELVATARELVRSQASTTCQQ